MANFWTELELLICTKQEYIAQKEALFRDFVFSPDEQISEAAFYQIRTAITGKGESLYEKIEECDKKIQDYQNEVVRCSMFDSKVLGPVLAHFITIKEERMYQYQELCYSNEKIQVVLPKNSNLNWIGQDIQDDEILVLGKKKIDTTSISFYSIDKEKHFLISNVSYGKFMYIKQFIDDLISYRMHQEIAIDEKQLKEFEKRYQKVKR